MTKIWFTTDEVAERYSLSPKTLRVWRVAGRELRGPKPTKLDGSVRYHIDDLLAWELKKSDRGPEAIKKKHR